MIRSIRSPREMAARLLVLGGLIAAPSFAGAQGTEEQRQACTPDVFRLCSQFIPNVQEITSCMVRKKSQLSPACRTAMRSSTEKKVASDPGYGQRWH